MVIKLKGVSMFFAYKLGSYPTSEEWKTRVGVPDNQNQDTEFWDMSANDSGGNNLSSYFPHLF